MSRIICPYCLKYHDFRTSYECEDHNQTVPAVYVRDYDKVPPSWLITVGFSQHGKTTYLAALTLMLEKISLDWEGMHYRPLNQFTIDKIRQMRREAINGELPPANLKELPLPLLFNVYDVPGSGSRCLVMYDVAGEVYNTLNEVKQYIPALKQASTIWFLVSLKDLNEDEEGKTITDLFHVYLTGMENLRIDLEGRNLIVIYTKADQVPFTPEIKKYLMSDPLQGLSTQDIQSENKQSFSLDTYLNEMNYISTLLKDYTQKRVPGGAAFISMVKASGLNLIFTLTSALGQSPDASSGRMIEKARRFRVLDPFLWALSLEMQPATNPLGLILDASQKSRSVYEADLLTEIWNLLSEHGALSTYYLGQNSPASQPGQRPPSAPPRWARQRLIGPLIENAPLETRFMVITTGPIIDLEDLYNTSWRDRILLITIGDDHQKNWPNSIIYRKGDAPMILVDTLLKLT